MNQNSLRRLTEATAFQGVVIALIIANAIIIGLETSATLMERMGTELHVIHITLQIAFIIEILLRILAHGSRPWDFFKSGWNLFDFSVVALSLLPQAGAFATVARLARILRVTRLVSAVPELRLLVHTMLRSIPSMGHVIMLLSLLLYLYGVTGFYLFHKIDPEHWGSLGKSLLTLFEVLTLEGWVELQDKALVIYPWAWIFFSSFILFAVFVVVNLFIAVVINNLEEAKRDIRLSMEPKHNSGKEQIAADLRKLKLVIEDLERSLKDAK